MKKLIMKLIRQVQLRRLQKQILNGSLFLRIINDELRQAPRHERKRIIRAMYKDGKLSDELIARCEVKADYLLRAMKGRLKVFKKKKAQTNKLTREANKKAYKEAISGAVPAKPPVKIKADKTVVSKTNDEAVDGVAFYENAKKQAEGK